MTIREKLLDIVAQCGEQTFLIDSASQRKITYSEFHRHATALAAELSNRDVMHGDRIGIMVPNCCELAILYFACMFVGATLVPLNPALSTTDVKFILGSCRPRLVFSSQSSMDRLKALHDHTVTLATSGEPATNSSSRADVIVLDKLLDANGYEPLRDTTDDDLLMIVYTSGTTAKPKGLAHTIGHVFRNASAFATVQGIDSTSRFYLTLSMAYMGGIYNLLFLPFLCGASVVVDHVFDARSSLNYWDNASRNEVNTLWLAPTIMSILMKMDRGKRGEAFCRDSVRRAFVGFAPLRTKSKEEFEARYGVTLVENYGLSETLFVTARSKSGQSESGYVGEPMEGIKLRVVDDNGSVVSLHSEGEVQILSPDLMAGYLDETGTLVPVSALNWFSTGDFGHLGHDGALCITGRKKDIIIRGGINISPAAIEEVLLHAQGIADAAVVSVPHELYGEDVVAVLKLEPLVELESILEAVVALAQQSLAAHQQPARYVVIDELPRTTNGKVQKHRLRELVIEKLRVGSESSLGALSRSS